MDEVSHAYMKKRARARRLAIIADSDYQVVGLVAAARKTAYEVPGVGESRTDTETLAEDQETNICR